MHTVYLPYKRTWKAYNAHTYRKVTLGDLSKSTWNHHCVTQGWNLSMTKSHLLDIWYTFIHAAEQSHKVQPNVWFYQSHFVLLMYSTVSQGSLPTHQNFMLCSWLMKITHCLRALPFVWLQLITPGLSKDIQCHVWPYSFSMVANHQIGHQATCNMGCQSDYCRWPVNLLQGFVWLSMG